MKKLFLITAACMAVMAPQAAQAFIGPLSGFASGYYAQINGGANWLEINKHHNHCGDGSFSGSRSHDRTNTGYYVSGTVGINTCSNFRFEVEGAYRNNQHNRRHHNSDVSGSTSGSHRSNRYLSSTAVLFNGLYDLDLCWAVKPYAGFGIGYAWTQTPRRDNQFFSGSSSTSGHRHNKRDRNGFAWQAIAGMAYPLDFLCSCGYNVDLTVEYRFYKPRANRVYANTLSAGLRTSF